MKKLDVVYSRVAVTGIVALLHQQVQCSTIFGYFTLPNVISVAREV